MFCGAKNNNTTVFKVKLAHSTFLSHGGVLSALLAATMLTASPNAAEAKPVHDSTSYGDVKIDCQCNNKMNVRVKSDKAIINWKEFSIGAKEHVEFHQKNANSVALNRVITNAPSNIMGKLTANGKIILVNQNGILFGAGSQVNVGGLVATTANISDENFINGNFSFDGKAPAGSSVVNKGSITVKEGGIAAFVAPNVRNDGTIYGNASRISLAGGDSFAIDLYGDGLVNLEVASVPSEVNNSGNILNQQGTVLLTTNDAQNIIGAVVNTDNIVVAQNARIVGKSIVLDGNSTGNVMVAGELDASGSLGLASSTRNGGNVTVKGQNIDIKNTANIDTRGALAGKGGDITVVAKNHTEQKGAIKAAGGFGSTGGTVEISGKTFVLGGDVNAGQGGTVIIDPENLYVRNGSGSTPEANSVYEEWIEAQSQGGTDVVLTASNLIRVEKINDTVIQGGSGSISLLANEGGSTTGRIEFARDFDTIQTTSGDINLVAGSGGINAGKLIANNTSGEAGTVTLTTTNGGDIKAREAISKGMKEAHVVVASDGAVDVLVATANAKSYNHDANASVNISSAKGKDVKLGTVNVASTATRTNTLTTSVEANAEANIISSGNLTVAGVHVNSLANVNDLIPDFLLATTPDVKANTKAKMQANGDIAITGQTKVAAEANGTSKSLLPGSATASADSLVDINSMGHITQTTYTENFATVTANGNGYDNVAANTRTNIHAAKSLTLNEKTNTRANATLTGKTNKDMATVSANNITFITSAGALNMPASMDVYAKAVSDSTYADTLNSVADATLHSHDADVTFGNRIRVGAEAHGAGDYAGKGSKADANSFAKLAVMSKNGNVTADSDSRINALTAITGNGYGNVAAETEAHYRAGNSLTVNDEIRSTAETRTDGVTVDDASSTARMRLIADGFNDNGAVLLNGRVVTSAKTTQSTDNAYSLLHVTAKDDNIVFVDGVADPRSYTINNSSIQSELQGRYTATTKNGTHTSRLVLLPHPPVPPVVPPAPPVPGATVDPEATLNPLFISPLERYLLSLRNSGVTEFSTENPYVVNMGEAKLSLLGNSNTDTSNLSPEQLGSLEPAAGGMAGDSTVSCANNYLDSGYGAPMNATCTLAQAF